MAFSTSKTHDPMQPSQTQYPHAQRPAPLGPRRVPDKLARHHTLDTATSLSPPVKSTTAIRSHTTDSQNPRAPHLTTLWDDVRSQKISSSQPTLSPLRSGSISDTGSLLPTDFVQSLGSSSLLASSAQVHTGTFGVSRGSQRTVLESRKSSAASTDRDAGAHLDLKRLLSKPAKHTPSGSSAISLPSDSELSVSSRNIVKLSKLSTGSHPSLRDREDALGGVSPPGAKSTSAHRPGSRETSSSSRNAEPEQSARQRNVLRRRPSRPGTSSSAGASDQPGSNSAPPILSPRRRMRSIGAFHVTSAAPATSSASSKTASARQTERPTLKALTPAGQVALAYKQQEQRREELAEMSGWDDPVRERADKNVVSSSSQSLQNISMDDDQEASGPYYTVFGSSSGHVVPVGSPYDYSPQLDGYVIGDVQSRKPPGSLSRKMSGRLRKVADLVKGDRPTPTGKMDGWRPYDGHSSPVPRSPISPVRMSTDDRGDVATQSSSRRSVLTARMHAHGKDRSIGEESVEDGWGSLPTRSMKGKDKDREEENGKWWKLVKRISTGGLRDKYRQSREGTPPPVPPLPVDLRKHGDSPRVGEVRDPLVREGSGDLIRFMQSRSSMSGVRPATASSQKTSSRHTTTSRPSTAGKASSSPSAHRPSTTTRSSSPISSDMASSGYFPRAHSTRSSTSSYGEEIPPVPKSNLGQYILAPSELRRLDSDQSKEEVPAPRKSRKPSRSHSEPVDHGRSTSSAEDALQSLPLPPRRPGTGSRDRGERPPSPTLPSFSTEGIVNNFSTPSLPLTEFGQAPPRPQRSSRRKPASIELPPASASFAVSSRSPVTPRTPRPRIQVSEHDVPLNRSPTSTLNNVSTTNSTPLSPASSSVSPSSTVSSQTRSPLTFRELESPRHAWTEQEKVDKWEALLERSARAGGTLHIGETGLLSESMRLSQYGET